MKIKITGEGRDAYTELFDNADRWLCAKAGKYTLKHMIKWWSKGCR